METKLIKNPLEQFELFWVFSFITNLSFFSLLGLLVLFLGIWYFSKESQSVLFSNREYLLKESLVGTILEGSTTTKGGRYLPIIVTVYFYILITNLIGMIPYSFTPTSHLVVTIGMSLPILIGVTIIGVQKKGWKFVGIWLPVGTPTWLIGLLTPIEIISYLARGMSLGVRLFANIVAGHALIHILAGFSWKGIILLISTIKSIMILKSLVLFLSLLLSLVIIGVFIGLEIMIAYLQAIVFTTLMRSYIEEVDMD